EVSFVPTLREGREEASAISTAIGHAFAAGAKVDWPLFFAGTNAKRVPLPTYPFQRKRYWLAPERQAGDAGAVGLTPSDHPRLGAAIEAPDGDGLSLAGRLSLQLHPWLADHRVGDSVLLPGTAFLELAMQAAARVGVGVVEELALEAPLVLPEGGAVAIRV